MTHLINTVLNNSWVIMNLVTSLFFNVKSWEVNFIFSKKIFTKRKANIKRQILSILSKDLDLTFFLRSIQTSRSPGRWISKKLYHGQFDQNGQNIKNDVPKCWQFLTYLWNRKHFVFKLIVLLPSNLSNIKTDQIELSFTLVKSFNLKPWNSIIKSWTNEKFFFRLRYTFSLTWFIAWRLSHYWIHSVSKFIKIKRKWWDTVRVY